MTITERLNPQALHHAPGKQCYRYPEDLELLHEIPCFVVVYDFLEFGKPRKLWANAPWLQYIGQSLDEFQRYDYASNVSAPVKKIQYDVGQQVQIGRQVSNLKLSMYPVDKPLPVLAMHQPLLVDSREPLLMVCHFNSETISADKDALALPLDFHFKGSLCAREHQFPQGLQLLDELPVLAVVYDFQEPAKPKHLWANSAWLKHTDQTLEEFLSTRFQLTSPVRMHEEVFTLWKEIQVKQKTFSFETVIDCAAQPLRARAVCRPIRLAGMATPMVLCTFVPPDTLSPGDERAQNHGDSLFERQVIGLLDEGATIFQYTEGKKFGQAIWANFRNRNEYGVVYDCSELVTRQGGMLTLDTVLDSCLWSGEEEKQALVGVLRGLAFDSDPLVVTCRKLRGRRVPVWHRLSFSRCKNPYTGEDCLLLLESDVSGLMQAQAELQASNDLKDKFLQCMSHELRTPLNGIMGLSSAIVHSPQCPNQLKTPLSTIDDSAKHLCACKAPGLTMSGRNSLVTDILETAECMAGSFQLHYAPINLVEICERVCDIMRPRLTNGVQLRTAVAADAAPSVLADAERIQKVLIHLVDNAVKFTERGSIVVHVFNDDGGQEQRGAQAAGTEQAARDGMAGRRRGQRAEERDGRERWVRVEVTDTGCGIPADVLPCVWDHFQQGDMSSTRQHGGTGLGLALVKLLVKAHGGEVTATSRQWEGGGTSSFGFTLPVKQHARQPPQDAAAAADWTPQTAVSQEEERGGAALLDSRTDDAAGGERGQEWQRIRELEAELREKRERIQELEGREERTALRSQGARVGAEGAERDKAGRSDSAVEREKERECQTAWERGEAQAAEKRVAEVMQLLEAERQKVEQLREAGRQLGREREELERKLQEEGRKVGSLQRTVAELEALLTAAHALREESHRPPHDPPSSCRAPSRSHEDQPLLSGATAHLGEGATGEHAQPGTREPGGTWRDAEQRSSNGHHHAPTRGERWQKDRNVEGGQEESMCAWCRQGEQQLQRAMRVLHSVRRDWVRARFVSACPDGSARLRAGSGDAVSGSADVAMK